MSHPLIFFSYSRHDGVEFTLKLAHDLYHRGINTWIDQENIPDGSEWVVEIEDALTNAAFVLYVVTENANNSSNVRNEIIYALEENKKLIPLKINDCKIPLFIRTYQYVDFSKDYEAGLNRLLATLDLNIETEHKSNKRRKVTAAGNDATEKENKNVKAPPHSSLRKTKLNHPQSLEEKKSIRASSVNVQKRYDSRRSIYNAFKDPLWWILAALLVCFSVACTYFGSTLFNYSFQELKGAAFQYHLSWTFIIVLGSCWGLAYAIKAQKNAPNRKFLFLGIGMPFFNIFLPDSLSDIIRGLFSALFINTLYTMLLSLGIAFSLNALLGVSYSIVFLISFIGINIFSLFKFIVEDFA